MARWQKRVRFGLGLFAVVICVVLWLMIGERQAPPPAAVVERLDPKAASEIRGGDAIQVKGAKRDIRVEFASQVLYTDGRTKYTGFKAFVDDRGGRSFVISGNEAWVGKDLSAYDVTGNVALKTSDGLTVTTPQATFTEAEGILSGAGPVQFQRGAYDRIGRGLHLRPNPRSAVAARQGGHRRRSGQGRRRDAGQRRARPATRVPSATCASSAACAWSGRAR